MQLSSLTTMEAPGIKPVKVDTLHTPDGTRDHARKGFNLTHLLRMLADCDDQPNWRRRAAVACAYTDGKQFSEEMQQALIEEGLSDVRPTNLIGRVVRAVLGAEAKNRTDVVLEADDEEFSEVVEWGSHQLKEFCRETKLDMAVSQGYFGQVVPGIGWVEVARTNDALAYPYAVREVHRDCIWWDWTARDVLLRDARWLVRKEWHDLDIAKALMPSHAVLLDAVSSGWNDFKFDDTDIDGVTSWTLSNSDRWNEYRSRGEWWDHARRRIKLYEVWYRIPAMAPVLHLSRTRRILFNEKNPAHVQAVLQNRVKVTKSMVSQVRMALFAGPHRLMDVGTNLRQFPYVPFIAYRDDETGAPYGLVEGMIAPQDGYNRRRARVEWLLRARQIIMDNDALDLKVNKLSDIAARVNRPDLNVVLNANRTRDNAFKIGNDLQAQAEQLTMMADDKQLIQEVPGVATSMLGDRPSGVTSGIANSLLIEQGAQALGDLNDNYRLARQAVHELGMQFIVEDHTEADIQVRVGRGMNRRVIVLNQWDPEAGEMRNNVADAPMRVGLGEVPSTPAFRMQQQQQLGTIIGALQGNPQAVAILSPAFIESTDLPQRKVMADQLRKLSGLPTSDEQGAEAKMAQMAAEQAAEQAEAARAAAALAAEQQAAEINKTKAETEHIQAKTVEIGATLGQAMGGARQQQPGPTPEEAEAAEVEDAIAEALGQ